MDLANLPDFLEDDLEENESIVWIGQPDPVPSLKVAIPLLTIGLLVSIATFPQLPLPDSDSVDPYGERFRVWLPFLVLLFVPNTLSLKRRFSELYYVLTEQNLYRIANGNQHNVNRTPLYTIEPLPQSFLFGKTNLHWSAPNPSKVQYRGQKPLVITLFGLPLDTPEKMGIVFPIKGETIY